MRWSFIFILSIVLILAACGGSDTGNTGGDASGEENSTSTNQEDKANSDDSNTENTQSEDSNSDERDLFQDVISYELEIEFSNGDEWSYDYEVENDGKNAEIERDGESDLDGSEAIDEVENMIEAVQPAPDLSYDEALQRVYNHLDINQDDVEEVELDVDFENGDTLEIERPS
ncbi:YusW family protein [Alkalibacillus almallahensis]|uniref:YusW family protein n=1 Tax=Alkalibacillus almallahensis TaxID=1379154 RepID=UPI001420A1A5|nr:YusW family protein [Alkalibacillus almallahensis]NIK11383.1 putative membrane protein YkoI [Alkalibacillus almallahensis]